MPRSRSRLLVVLAFAGAILGVMVVLLAAPHPAAALCPVNSDTCDPGGGGTGTTTQTYTYTLTVNRPSVGTVTSSPAGINCPAGSGGTCSVTQSQTDTCDPTCSPDDLTWDSYTLSLSGGAGGYNPSWTNCPSVNATNHTCTVGMEGSSTVTPGWADVQGPSIAGLSVPNKTGPTLNVAGSATDNSGTVANLRFAVQGTSIYTDATPTNSGGVWSAGASLNLSSLNEGTYTIVETATDGSLNTSPTPSTHNVTLDKTIHLTLGTIAPTVNAIPSLSFTTDSDVPSANMQCAYYPSGGSPAYASCASPFQPSSLADGAWVYDVKVTDDVGNTTHLSRAFTLDTLAPALSESSGPTQGQVIANASPSITIGESELHPGTFTCTIDGAATACSAGGATVLSNLADGGHTFTATATDAAGNSSTLTRQFVVDRLVPALSEASGPTEGQTINTAAPSITIAETELHPGTFTCTIDGGAQACGAGSATALSNLGEGVHTFVVTAADAVGNSTTLTRHFTVDTTPPALSLDGPSEGGTVATSSIHVTPSESELHPATLECQLDSAAFAPCASGTQVALTGLANGSHSFTVHAVDVAGNKATLTRTFLVQVPVATGPGTTSTGGSGSNPTPPGSSTPPAINALLSFSVKRSATRTAFRSVVLHGVPSGATIKVSCAGSGCPAPKHWTLHRSGTVPLTGITGHRLGAGTKVTIVVAKAGMRTRTFVLTVRRGKAPTKTTS